MTFSPIMKPNKFYRKPKPETIKKNREAYKKAYADEIEWIKGNVSKVQKHNKFLFDMYMILITGNRKITPKMESAIINGVIKCKNSPLYNEELAQEADEKLKPILEKIVMVERLAEKKNDKAQTFVRSVKQYVQMNYRITKKQMEGLNKIYKRCSEDLFKKDEDETK